MEKKGLEIMREDQRLRIEIKNHQPVQLVDLTNSFFCAADEYKRFMLAEYGELPKDDVSLYVQEIRTGSIITDLIGISPALPPIIAKLSDIATVIRFGQYLKKGYDFLLGRTTEDLQLSKNSYENLAGFVEPVAKDGASQMNIQNVFNGDPTLIFNLSSVDANAAQNTAKRIIGTLAEPSTGAHSNVVLYWYQAKKDMVSNTGDRIIIESIYPYPVKAIFDNDAAKTKMLLGNDNPFMSAYRVDVAVETIKGKPVLYKILNIHERIDLPPQRSIDFKSSPKPKRAIEF